MQTYSQFKDHLTTFLWKQNDTDLIARLDSLIKMGTSELDRMLDITRRETSVVVTVTSTADNADVILPADFKQMIALTSADCVFANATTQQLLTARKGYTGKFQPMYHVAHNGTQHVLQMVGSGELGDEFALTYRNKLPDYEGTDASWLEDEYLDLYTYTVLKHCAPFLREDERIQTWIQLATQAMTTVIEEDRHSIEFGGADAAMSLNGSNY